MIIQILQLLIKIFKLLGFKNMCLLENVLLCIGGNNSKGFYLIKISTHQLIKNIIGPKTIYSINECLDDLFLCSIIDEKGNHSLVKYKYEEQDLKKLMKRKKHILIIFIHVLN